MNIHMTLYLSYNREENKQVMNYESWGEKN